MYILFHFLLLFVIITQIKSQQVLNEHLKISTQKPGEKINLKNVKIERRFIEDLDDDEWYVAHLRTAVLDGRRECQSDTFADKVQKYKRMLKQDGARVKFVSADPLPVDPAELIEESCLVKDDLTELKNTSQITATTLVSQNATSANTTDKMTETETTPKLDFKATTEGTKTKEKSKKSKDKKRRSEYMFSSVEYYDESIEFNASQCPDAVEIISLQIDQLRSYDLECETIVEWRSLE